MPMVVMALVAMECPPDAQPVWGSCRGKAGVVHAVKSEQASYRRSSRLAAGNPAPHRMLSADNNTWRNHVDKDHVVSRQHRSQGSVRCIHVIVRDGSPSHVCDPLRCNS